MYDNQLVGQSESYQQQVMIDPNTWSGDINSTILCVSSRVGNIILHCDFLVGQPISVPTQPQMVLDPSTGQYIPAQTQVKKIIIY